MSLEEPVPCDRQSPAWLTRNVVFYVGSRFCSGTANTMLRAAIAWHVYSLTDSAFHLGLIGLVQFLPALGLTLIGGAVADTYERRRVIMLAQLVPLACAVDAVRRHPRPVSPACRCSMRWSSSSPAPAAFENPARAALLPTLVPREVFPRAVTLASTGQALAFMSGPASGGMVIAGFGVGTVYGVLPAC